jgi:hypothetical protein
VPSPANIRSRRSWMQCRNYPGLTSAAHHLRICDAQNVNDPRRCQGLGGPRRNPSQDQLIPDPWPGTRYECLTGRR